ncbi:MAG: alcohol dehydrogenase catalytic domain-containing protein [Chloroflexi bacterium]|nr:alcohol dehydrogenase catalytic domain-containing protein [Chloroflexota bacterium]
MQGTMLAARAYPGETRFRLESVPIPPIESGEVLVRVHAAGLTHGLLSLWHNGRTQLLSGVLGHEAAGAVAEIGPGAKRWSCSSSCAPDGWTFRTCSPIDSGSMTSTAPWSLWTHAAVDLCS